MKGREKQEDKRGRGPKILKNTQKIKQLQPADNDSDSENMPTDILDEEL